MKEERKQRLHKLTAIINNTRAKYLEDAGEIARSYGR